MAGISTSPFMETGAPCFHHNRAASRRICSSVSAVPQRPAPSTRSAARSGPPSSSSGIAPTDGGLGVASLTQQN